MKYKIAIFDLSEVLIKGIVGTEKMLITLLKIEGDKILKAFSGDNLKKLCYGNISEEEYFKTIKKNMNWDISIDVLKKAVRDNFDNVIYGMPEYSKEISKIYEPVLYSDHSKEWVEYILKKHTFLNIFKSKVFSFEIGKLKDEKGSFELMLSKISKKPDECIFIDDNMDNITNAENVGIKSIRFTNCEDLRAKMPC